MKVKEQFSKMPKLLLIPIIAFGAMCIFSLVVGIYLMTGLWDESVLSVPVIAETYSEVINALELTNVNIPEFSLHMGLLTAAVGIFQGITSFGLIKGWKAMWFFAIAFTLFSLIMVVSKFTIEPSLFGTGKTILYIIELAIYFLPSVRKYVWNK